MQIGGNEYTVSKLDPMSQFHVLRKIMPIASYLNDAFQKLTSIPKSEEEFLALAVGPLADSLSKMPKDDVEFVIYTCLSVCHKKIGTAVVPVLAGDMKTFMEPMELPQMLGLTMEVIRSNFSSFFPTEEPKSPQGQ